jgi:hypothetical protein
MRTCNYEKECVGTENRMNGDAVKDRLSLRERKEGMQLEVPGVKAIPKSLKLIYILRLL